jgi:hypothetical protein
MLSRNTGARWHDEMNFAAAPFLLASTVKLIKSLWGIGFFTGALAELTLSPSLSNVDAVACR